MQRNLVPHAIILSVVAACASNPLAKNVASPHVPAGAATNASQPTQDACRASQSRYLVGKKRSALPAKPDGANWRIACSSCAVTLEFTPTRMNIFFDEKTDVIKEVKCG